MHEKRRKEKRAVLERETRNRTNRKKKKRRNRFSEICMYAYGSMLVSMFVNLSLNWIFDITGSRYTYLLHPPPPSSSLASFFVDVSREKDIWFLPLLYSLYCHRYRHRRCHVVIIIVGTASFVFSSNHCEFISCLHSACVCVSLSELAWFSWYCSLDLPFSSLSVSLSPSCFLHFFFNIFISALFKYIRFVLHAVCLFSKRCVCMRVHNLFKFKYTRSQHTKRNRSHSLIRFCIVNFRLKSETRQHRMQQRQYNEAKTSTREGKKLKQNRKKKKKLLCVYIIFFPFRVLFVRHRTRLRIQRTHAERTAKKIVHTHARANLDFTKVGFFCFL